MFEVPAEILSLAFGSGAYVFLSGLLRQARTGAGGDGSPRGAPKTKEKESEHDEINHAWGGEFSKVASTAEPEPLEEASERVSSRSGSEMGEPEPGPEPDAGESGDSSGDEGHAKHVAQKLKECPATASPAGAPSGAADAARRSSRGGWLTGVWVGMFVLAALVEVYHSRVTLGTPGAPGNAVSDGASERPPAAAPSQEDKTATELASNKYAEMLATGMKKAAPSSAAVAAVPGPAASEKEEEGSVAQAQEALITMNLTKQAMTMTMVGNVPYFKSAYWGTLAVGTPQQHFKVVFDTGSGHLILPSTYCHVEACRVHNRYRRSRSTSAKDIDYDGTAVAPGAARDQITVNFGTGEVTGVFMEDTVCVDDRGLPPSASTKAQENGSSSNAEAPELPPGCVKLRMIAATEMSEEPFKDFEFDGVLGLGLSGLSQTAEFNFPGVMAGLARELGGNPATANTFAVFLAEHPLEESELTLGGWASRRFEGDRLAWSPVYEPDMGHWLIRIRRVLVDGQPVNFCEQGDCRAVVDSGTSLISVPTQSFSEIFEMLRHPAPLEGHCTGRGPEFQFELEGADNYTLRLRPEDYSRAERTSSPSAPVNLARAAFARDAARARAARRRQEDGTANATARAEAPPQPTRRDLYCKPMLMSMDLPAPVGPKLFILGEPVLRRYYTVYDMEGERVGFAPARHVPPPPGEAPALQSDAWFWEADEEAEAEKEKDEAAAKEGKRS